MVVIDVEDGIVFEVDVFYVVCYYFIGEFGIEV